MAEGMDGRTGPVGEYNPKTIGTETLDGLARRLGASAGQTADASSLSQMPPGVVGFTHFDAPNSADDDVVLLILREHLEAVTSGSMVRLESPADVRTDAPARTFQAVITAGPFVEPTGLKVETPPVVAATLGGRAAVMLPAYHGRAHARVTAEIVDGKPIPPRRRPRPNSMAVPLTEAETAVALKVGGDVPIGRVLGADSIEVALDTTSKHQLPRHLAVLGTTGGGKSVTIAGMVHGLSRSGVSVVLFDVEGEYVDLDAPTTHDVMLAAMAERGGGPSGVSDFRVLHPVGRESARERTGAEAFCVAFESLSPYAVMDVLDLSDAQQTRFLKAYDILKAVMRELHVFPRVDAYKQDMDRLSELDELESGYPLMTLGMLRDVIEVCRDAADKESTPGGGRKKAGEEDVAEPATKLYSPELRDRHKEVRRSVAAARPPGHYVSWQALLSKLNRVARLRIFDNPKARSVDAESLVKPGRVTVIDLSDTDSPVVNNLVIAATLRAVRRQQERAVERATAAGERPTPTLVVIEEAHEFLSAARVRQQPHLFEQVATIAKRGRKRWLGLAFVTQLPQHLPEEVLGLVNNYVLHAVRDPQVVRQLSRQIPGLDESQWKRLPSLAPGQAVVSLATADRPVLASIDPAPGRLRMTE